MPWRAAWTASRCHTSSRSEIVLNEPDPQILFWFAMPFTTPTPWEAVAYYDGNEGARALRIIRSAPAPTGCRSMTSSSALSWSAIRAGTDWAAGAMRQARCFQRRRGNDIADGLIDPDYVGKRLPFLERIEFRRERESIPRFNKFLQGYYDNGGIIKESFDAVIQDDRLSPEMAAVA